MTTADKKPGTHKPEFDGEWVKLGDVCEITMGQSPDSSSYNADCEGLSFYQGNADFGETHPTPRIWCSEPKKVAEAGDILISVRAPVGAINVADERCCIGRGLAAVRPSGSDISNAFLALILQSKRAYLDSMSTGSTFKAIGKKVLSSCEAPLYSHEAQSRIACQINGIDDCLRSSRKLLSTLDDLVKSQFVEMFGTSCNTIYPVCSVKELCSAIVDCPHATPRYQGNLVKPCIRTSELAGNSIEWSTMRYVSQEEYLERTRRIKPLAGDVVYAREGSYGNAAVLPDGIDFCLGQRTMLFRPHPKRSLSAYVLHALTSDDVRRQADMLNSGSTVPYVNVADAKRFVVPNPPLALQQQFADFVARVDKLGFDSCGDAFSACRLLLVKGLAGGVQDGEGPSRRGSVHKDEGGK